MYARSLHCGNRASRPLRPSAVRILACESSIRARKRLRTGASPGGGMLRGLAGPLLAVSLWLLPRSAAAQDASDSAAYRALTQTPPAAFALSLGPAITGRRGSGPAVSGRYGLMSFRTNDYIHNFGLGVDGPVA